MIFNLSLEGCGRTSGLRCFQGCASDEVCQTVLRKQAMTSVNILLNLECPISRNFSVYCHVDPQDGKQCCAFKAFFWSVENGRDILTAAWLLVSTQLSLLPKNNQIKKNKHISHIISDYHQLLVYFLSSSSLCLDENG